MSVRSLVVVVDDLVSLLSGASEIDNALFRIRPLISIANSKYIVTNS
jgi:hypothetical protein